MYFSHLLGTINTNAGQTLDSSLLFLFLPLTIFIVVFLIIKRFVGVSRNGVSLGIKTTNSILFSLIALFAVEKVFQGMAGLGVIGFLANIDVLIIGILSVLIFFRRFGLARALMPAVLILVGASLFNNARSTIDVLQLVIDLVAVGLSIFIALFTNKVIFAHSFVLATFLTTSLIIYTYFVYYNLSQNSLLYTGSEAGFHARNLLVNDFEKMLGFAGVALFAKVFIWLMSRVFFVVAQNGNARDLLFWKERKDLLKNVVEFVEKLSGLNLKNKLHMQFEESELEAVQEEPKLVLKYKLNFHIIPTSIQKIFNAQGIRAPSQVAALQS